MTTSETSRYAPFIDDTYFGQLADMNDPEFLTSTIRDYIRTVEEVWDSMKANLDSNNLDTLSKQVHSISSCSGNLGAKHVHERAKAIEKAAKSGDSETCKALFAVMTEDYATVKAWFEEYCRTAS